MRFAAWSLLALILALLLASPMNWAFVSWVQPPNLTHDEAGFTAFAMFVSMVTISVMTARWVVYGQHREPGEAVGGGAADGAGAGEAATGVAGGAAAGTGGAPLTAAEIVARTQQAFAATNASANAAAMTQWTTWPRIPLPPSYIPPPVSVITTNSTGFISPSQLYPITSPYYNPAEDRFVLPPAEIRMGEIIGWRAWRCDGQWIRAVAAGTVWAPGDAMRDDSNPGSRVGVGSGGVHAWKDKTAALNYIVGESSGCTYIIGRVALWGEVVECELGYRAEFAKPVSFDEWVCHSGIEPSMRDAALAGMRKKYGLKVGEA